MPETSGDVPNPIPQVRLIGPDIIRFVAASLVLIRHWGITHETNKTFINYFWLVAGGADLGVDIFFVLSGFLVSGLLFQELNRTGTVSITRFLIRRGFKIYPAYWVFLIFAVLALHFKGVHVSAIELTSLTFFFQNYLSLIWSQDLHSVWFPTWSLAVEEHFYLLLAGVFWLFKRRSKPGEPWRMDVPRIFAYTAIICAVLRYITGEMSMGFDAGTYKLPSHLRIDSLLFGVLLSYYWHVRWTPEFKAALLKWRWLFWAIGIGMLLPNFLWYIVDRRSTYVMGDAVVYVGSGFLLLASLGMDGTRAPAPLRLLAWLGKNSYSVYLWHMAILEFLVLPIKEWEPVPAFPGVYFAFFFVSAWLAGVLFAQLIENHSLKLRDRLFPSFQKTKTA